MNTLEFLRAVLPAEGGYFMALKRKFLDKATNTLRDGTLHKFYPTIEELAGGILSADSRPDLGSVWHANQSYIADHIITAKGKQWRVAENRPERAHKALYLDIDVGEQKAADGKGYPTKSAAFAALKSLIRKVKLPTPIIVDSGGGLHIYWPLTEAVTAQEWRTLAMGLSSACIAEGFIQDTSVTTDVSRVLRPVGSHNRKYDPPRQVVTKNESYDVTPFETFRALLASSPDAFQGMLQLGGPGNIDSMLGLAPEYPPSSLVKVAERCAQVRLMRDTLGDVGYDHWRGVIGLGTVAVDGADLVREWSTRRAETGHAQCDVDARLNDWNAGPTTCEFFGKHGAPNLCTGCEFKAKITSPLHLGSEITVQPETTTINAVTENATPVEIEIPSLPGFVWWESKGVMVRQWYDKDGLLQETPFTRTRLFPINRIRDDSGKYVLQMRMLLPDNKYRDFDLPTSAISTGGTDLRKALGAYEIYPTDNRDAAIHMDAFARNWAEEIKRKCDEMRKHDTFGWNKEKDAFLLGTQLIRRGKPDAQVLVSRGAATHAAALSTRRGTVTGWCNAVASLYDRQGMEPLQYALLSGFGSILTPFFSAADYHGIPCYLFSDGSGVGKSTVAKLAISAWGDIERMTINGPDGATRNGRMARMSTFNNLPINHDELTDCDPKFIADLAFTFSNGTDKVRCVADGSGEVYERESGTWNSSPLMNGNTDLLSMMASQRGNTMAEAVRIFQIALDKYDLPKLDGGWVQLTVDQAIQNTGVVGEAFARWCVNNRERLDALLREELAALSGPVVDDNVFRFYKGHMVCTLTAGRILVEEMGVLGFHMDIVRGWAHMHATTTCKAVKETNSINPEDALARLVSDISPDVMVTNELRDSRAQDGNEEPLFMPRGVLKGRYVYGSNRQQQYAGRLFVTLNAIKQWCLEHRTSPASILDAATKADALVPMEDNRFYLGQGTAVPTGRVRVVCFDMNKLHGVQGMAPQLTLVKPIRREESA